MMERSTIRSALRAASGALLGAFASLLLGALVGLVIWEVSSAGQTGPTARAMAALGASMVGMLAAVGAILVGPALGAAGWLQRGGYPHPQRTGWATAGLMLVLVAAGAGVLLVEMGYLPQVVLALTAATGPIAAMARWATDTDRLPGRRIGAALLLAALVGALMVSLALLLSQSRSGPPAPTGPRAPSPVR